MPYCEWWDTVRGHHKTNNLMRKLKISRREAVGIIGCISSWAMQYRPGGVIARNLIPPAVEWEGDDDALLQALIDSGWLDDLKNGSVKIHDWEEVTRGYRKSQEDYRRRIEKLGKTPKPQGEEEAVVVGPGPDPTTPGAPPTEEVEFQVNPDRSSSPEALIAEEYMRWNPNLHRRGIVTAKIAAAKKAGAELEDVLAAAMNEKQCKDVEIWDFLKPFIPVSESPKAKRVEADLKAVDAIIERFTPKRKAAN